MVPGRGSTLARAMSRRSCAAFDQLGGSATKGFAIAPSVGSVLLLALTISSRRTAGGRPTETRAQRESRDVGVAPGRPVTGRSPLFGLDLSCQKARAVMAFARGFLLLVSVA